jgi:hypothetical protein
VIFAAHACIFLHPGKTGGTSIERLLDGEVLDPFVAHPSRLFGWDASEGVYLQHATAEATRARVGTTVFERYYKLSVVRNPFSRIVSVFHYQHQRHMRRFGSFEGFVSALPAQLEEPVARAGNHISPQHLYTHLGDEPICDHVAIFEDLERSLEPAISDLGLHGARLGHVASPYEPGRRSVPDSFGSREVADVVRRSYARDFEIYGYPLEVERWREPARVLASLLDIYRRGRGRAGAPDSMRWK